MGSVEFSCHAPCGNTRIYNQLQASGRRSVPEFIKPSCATAIKRAGQEVGVEVGCGLTAIRVLIDAAMQAEREDRDGGENQA